MTTQIRTAAEMTERAGEMLKACPKRRLIWREGSPQAEPASVQMVATAAESAVRHEYLLPVLGDHIRLKAIGKTVTVLDCQSLSDGSGRITLTYLADGNTTTVDLPAEAVDVRDQLTGVARGSENEEALQALLAAHQREQQHSERLAALRHDLVAVADGCGAGNDFDNVLTSHGMEARKYDLRGTIRLVIDLEVTAHGVSHTTALTAIPLDMVADVPLDMVAEEICDGLPRGQWARAWSIDDRTIVDYRVITEHAD